MHLTRSALRVPQVVLFAGTLDSRQWAPRWRRACCSAPRPAGPAICAPARATCRAWRWTGQICAAGPSSAARGRPALIWEASQKVNASPWCAFLCGRLYLRPVRAARAQDPLPSAEVTLVALPWISPSCAATPASTIALPGCRDPRVPYRRKPPNVPAKARTAVRRPSDAAGPEAVTGGGMRRASAWATLSGVAAHSPVSLPRRSRTRGRAGG